MDHQAKGGDAAEEQRRSPLPPPLAEGLRGHDHAAFHQELCDLTEAQRQSDVLPPRRAQELSRAAVVLRVKGGGRCAHAETRSHATDHLIRAGRLLQGPGVLSALPGHGSPIGKTWGGDWRATGQRAASGSITHTLPCPTHPHSRRRGMLCGSALFFLSAPREPRPAPVPCRDRVALEDAER
jgi:hypothetical protein